MSNSFKKKKYGMVKPVKPAKQEKLKKPVINDLKAVFRRIESCDNNAHLDMMLRAIYWWHKALPYIHTRLILKPVPIRTSNALLKAGAYATEVGKHQTDKEKEQSLINALDNYRIAAQSVIPSPPVAPHLKKMREYQKKHRAANKHANKRFDKYLRLMSQAYAQCWPANIEVKTNLNGKYRDDNWMISHDKSTIYVSKSWMTAFMRESRAKGILLPLLRFGEVVARALSFPVVPPPLAIYRHVYESVIQFAAFNPDAPKTLVKRQFKKKSANEVDAAIDGMDKAMGAKKREVAHAEKNV